MSNITNNQSFNVDDIRRIRNEDAERHMGMTEDEIWHDIHEGAQEVKKIIEQIRQEKRLTQPQ